MSTEPILKAADEGEAVAVVGDVYRFLATGDETNGRYATFDAVVYPGGGPPPHTHSRENESFYVLDGEVVFYIGAERQVAGAGTFASIPPGCVHAFKNESDQPARMLISVAPAGLEKMFLEIGRPIARDAIPGPPTTEEIAKLLATAPRYGVTIEARH